MILLDERFLDLEDELLGTRWVDLRRCVLKLGDEEVAAAAEALFEFFCSMPLSSSFTIRSKSELDNGPAKADNVEQEGDAEDEAGSDIEGEAKDGIEDDGALLLCSSGTMGANVVEEVDVADDCKIESDARLGKSQNPNVDRLVGSVTLGLTLAGPGRGSV